MDTTGLLNQSMETSPITKARHANTEVGRRDVKPLPIQILDHCTICFEEQLFSQAFALLSSTLTSGEGTGRPTYLPPVQHISLAATLAVHPSTTTRTTSRDKHAGANDALQYIQHIRTAVGPRDAGLAKAFQFRETGSSRAKRARTRQSDLSDDEDEPGHIRSSYAREDSLWSNADDLWSVVGWAFNCSVAYKHRWERWKLWLNFMLDVLEQDLDERCVLARKEVAADRTDVATVLLDEALLNQYLRQIGEGRNNKRRIMRAILADGQGKVLAEFGEIWKNETKLPKKKDEAKNVRNRKLDLDRGDFGDYFDDDSDQDNNNSPAATSLRTSRSATHLSSRNDDEKMDLYSHRSGSRTPNSTTITTTPPITLESFGGKDSIELRQRLLALLVHFCAAHPTAFISLEDLLDLYTEFLRPLPLQIFKAFVVPAQRYLQSDGQVSLHQMLLRPLLAATAPVYSQSHLTQKEFETHYAPYPANVTSVVENAKVSLLVEDLLRLLWRSGGVVGSAGLRRCVELGIGAREKKAGFDGRRKTGSKLREEEEAASEMESSGKRMRLLLDMLQ